jgi:glycosyltransferase involved in cell wall biosynthesis
LALPGIGQRPCRTDSRAEKGSKNMGMPLVSVIIPVKNGERYVGSAIESVIRTNYSPMEIIVVDGNSVDGTADIIKAFKTVRHVYQKGRGLADAWNLGIAVAEGELVAFLDSDDLWTPEKLKLQVGYLVDDPSLQYVISRFKFFLEPGFAVPVGFKKELLEGDHLGRIPGTLLARRSLFDEVGVFNTDIAIAADVDWFVRAKDQGIPMGIVPEVLLHKRVHDANLSSNAEKNNQELLALLRQSISRAQGQKG